MLQFSSFQGKSGVTTEQIGTEETKRSQWKEGATCMIASIARLELQCTVSVGMNL